MRTSRLLNLYDHSKGASLSEPYTGGIAHVRVYACLLACLLAYLLANPERRRLMLTLAWQLRTMTDKGRLLTDGTNDEQ